jgi:type I restriction enzyme, S subunit
VSSRGETKTGGRPASNGVIPGSFALSVGRPARPEPPEWRWTALTDVARLETGHTPSRKHPEYWGGDVPWVGIKDATENHGRVISDTHQHTNELGIANSSARILPMHTVCLSRTASVGYVVVMGQPMATSQDFVNWVCSEAIDYRFLKYVLVAEREAFLRFASGTTHQTIYFPEVKAFHVCLPPLPEQRAIAHILGTLDDKIELNQRMNETLEAMARALFKSWFVDFDPVRAKAEGRDPGLPQPLADLFPESFEDSELGEIPKGWKIGRFGDVVKQLRDQENPLSSPDELFHHFSIPAFDEGQSPKPEYGESIKSLKSRVPAGVILISKLNPEIERVWMVDVRPGERAVCSTEFLVLTAQSPFTRSYVYCLARSPLFRQQIEGLVTGTSKSHQRAQVDSILNLAVVVPPLSIVASFDHSADSLLARTLECRRETHTLAALRDTLLPKLISGELRVALPKALAEVME